MRVQFAGSSAKRVAKSSIASGDEVMLCLDGVEWIHDDGNVSTPGRGIEFELRFTERVLLKVIADGMYLQSKTSRSPCSNSSDKRRPKIQRSSI